MPPKRKSDVNAAASSSKKPRLDNTHATAVALVGDILENRFTLPDDDEDIMKSFVSIAQYARSMSQALTESEIAAVPTKKSAEQLEVAADKVRRAAVAGIKKQMTWKASCKLGTSKWIYDGVCPEPEVFGAVVGLCGPPNFKMKKIPVAEFEDFVGRIKAHARYSNLRITGKDVNVRWSDSGEFKFSGTYGV